MRMTYLELVAAALLLASGCVEPGTTSETPAPQIDPMPQDPPSGRVEVTLDNLEPGWRVTTSRIVAGGRPTERTQIADGSSLTLVGSAKDVFVATITDATGLVVGSHAMTAPCTMSGSRQLNVPREYPTIQAAIDAASPGDTVKVHRGTYHESLRMRPGVCLLGSGAKHTILDALGEPKTLVDLSGAPGSVVSGFTLRGVAQATGCAQPSDPFLCSGNWYAAGLYLGGSDWHDPTHDAPPVIVNNVFEDNDVGAMFYWRAVAVLRNNVFVRNRVGFMANHFQDGTLVANNVFVANTDLAIGNQGAYLDIIDNVFVGSKTAIRFQYIQTGHIACNLFWDNTREQSDVHIVPPRFTLGEDGNYAAEPKFVGDGDYRLRPDSPAKDRGCHGDAARELDGTLPDLGAFGGALGVWPEL